MIIALFRYYINRDVNGAQVEELILYNKWVTISNLSSALELSSRALHNQISDGRTQKISIFRLLFYIFSGLKKDISSWNPQWDMGAPLHSNNTDWNAVATPKFSEMQIILSLSVCWKSYGICFLGCKGIIHIEYHALGHSSQCESHMRPDVITTWGCLQEETWTSVMRCDPSSWQCNSTRHMSDTSYCSCFPGNWMVDYRCHVLGPPKPHLGDHQFHIMRK